MKKIMSIGLVFCLIISVILSTCVSVQALNDVDISIGGETSKVQYSQVNNSEVIYFYTSSTKVVNQYVLPPEGSVNHYRLIFEISDTSVPHTVRFDVNKGSVGQVRLANLSDPKRINVVVELDEKPDYTLKASGKALELTLKGDSNDTTPVNTPVPPTTPTPTPSVTPNPSTPIPSNSPGYNGSTITVNGPLSWELSGDTCVVTLKGITLSQTTSSSMPRLELREKERILQITIPGNDSRFKKGYLSGNSIIKGILVNYNDKSNSTIIRISYSDNISFTNSVSNGNTIIKIKKGTVTPPPTTTPNPKPTPTPNPTTPTPPTTPDPDGSVPDRGTPSTIKNIKAGDGSNVVLRIVNKGIVNRYRQYSDEIITDDSEKNDNYTFMIPIEIVDLGSGTLSTPNGLIKSIISYTTGKSSFLMLNKAKSNQQFEIIEGSGSDELLVVPASNSTNTGSKLIVLDPGHGGSDPGATVGSYFEKHYNLDIALKCMSILKAKGVNVDITRTKDVFVSLDGRAEYANNRKADLFVSIHNNIMPSSYKGSMVLYYPTSYKGKAYAQIIQDNLVSDLKTGNIGLKKDGDLVVLRKTKMPAVLAEIACMSDAGDMNQLNTEAFRQKAAQSLADSVIEILGSI